MNGICKQVARYKASAKGARNMGSKASPEQMRAAKGVSLGHGRTTITRAKPSWEGYQSGHSTYIHMNGTGYDTTPKARQNRRGPTDFSGSNRTTNPISRVSTMRHNIFDYTYSGSPGNSINIMSKRRTLDLQRF